MQTVIIVVHLLIVLALIVVVLLQRSEAGLGLGGGGGVSGFMTGRGQANALTKATWTLAGLFFLTSLILTGLADRGTPSSSILDRSGPASPAAPATEPQGGILDELRRLQQQPANPAPQQ